MTNSKIIDLPEIGEVLLEKSRQAKRVNITVRPFKGIRVAVPKGVSFKQAAQVAEGKAGWIRAQQERLRHIEHKHRACMEESGYVSRACAKGIIIGRLEELAAKLDISYNRVFIRNQKTRWGSCSSKKNLSLNYKIALLPGPLMDYVLLHELVHIRHPDHGSAFWEALDRIVGDAKELDRQLDEYSGLLLL